MFVPGPWKAEEGIRFPGIGVIDSYELPYGYWELNPRPLEEQYMLLTTEPSPQPPNNRFSMMADQGWAHIYPLLRNHQNVTSLAGEPGSVKKPVVQKSRINRLAGPHRIGRGSGAPFPGV